MIETKAKYDKSRIFQIFCLKHEQNQEILGTINNRGCNCITSDPVIFTVAGSCFSL